MSRSNSGTPHDGEHVGVEINWKHLSSVRVDHEVAVSTRARLHEHDDEPEALDEIAHDVDQRLALAAGVARREAGTLAGESEHTGPAIHIFDGGRHGCFRHALGDEGRTVGNDDVEPSGLVDANAYLTNKILIK